MTRFWEMYCFHIKQYFRNSYFLWLVITSTLSLLLLKYIGSYAQGQMITSQDIIMSGTFGMWSSAVTSAGILHFQRHQGVLVHLVNSPRSALVNLLALVSAPASFGILAYPIAYLAAGLLNNFHFAAVSGLSIFYIFLFWLSALTITYVVAELFLLTPNAFIYENLFVTPIMIFSGLFSLSAQVSHVLGFLSLAIPISYPVQLLTGERKLSLAMTLAWLLIGLIWLVVARLVFKFLIVKIRVTGEVEAM